MKRLRRHRAARWVSRVCAAPGPGGCARGSHPARSRSLGRDAPRRVPPTGLHIALKRTGAIAPLERGAAQLDALGDARSGARDIDGRACVDERQIGAEAPLALEDVPGDLGVLLRAAALVVAWRRHDP